MAKKMKKKSVHWSKLPRTKLIGMVKRLELANAKLKTQLAEMRETKLLNDATAASTARILTAEIKREQEISASLVTGNDFEHALSNPFMSADEAALAETFGVVHVKQQPAKMPWE